MHNTRDYPGEARVAHLSRRVPREAGVDLFCAWKVVPESIVSEGTHGEALEGCEECQSRDEEHGDEPACVLGRSPFCDQDERGGRRVGERYARQRALPVAR